MFKPNLTLYKLNMSLSNLHSG